ncbi:MAG: N-formylglutamate amidohydrolase [Actinomycetota bacterium]
MTPFELKGWAPTVPVIGHVPHSATAIPAEVRSTILLADDDLHVEKMRVTDHLTDRLYEHVLHVGGAMFVNGLSRLVFDPERFRKDEDEYMASRGAGAVYRKTSLGHDLRDANFTNNEREQILIQYFDPYALGFENAVSDILDSFGRCTIIDCHSFPKVALGWELHPDAQRPSLCFGTDGFHTPRNLVENLTRRAGGDVLVDIPFKGTYTPIRFWNKDPRVTSIMIEVRRDTYCDEETGKANKGFDAVQRLLASLIEDISEAAATP